MTDTNTKRFKKAIHVNERDIVSNNQNPDFYDLKLSKNDIK